MTYHTTEELIGGRSEWAVSPNNFNGLIDSHLLANQRIAELEAQLSGMKDDLAAVDEKTELTLAEMRERLEKAKEWHKPCYEDWLSRNSWILDLALEALAQRVDMENSNG